jgi:multiple antibiotic resistance protein
VRPSLTKIVARKIAINTVLFLVVVAMAGPYVLEFFGISVDILQVVGGTVLAAMVMGPSQQAR